MSGLPCDLAEDANLYQAVNDLIRGRERRPDQVLHVFGADDRMLVEVLQDTVAISGRAAEAIGNE